MTTHTHDTTTTVSHMFDTWLAYHAKANPAAPRLLGQLIKDHPDIATAHMDHFPDDIRELAGHILDDGLRVKEALARTGLHDSHRVENVAHQQVIGESAGKAR